MTKQAITALLKGTLIDLDDLAHCQVGVCFESDSYLQTFIMIPAAALSGACHPLEQIKNALACKQAKIISIGTQLGLPDKGLVVCWMLLNLINIIQ